MFYILWILTIMGGVILNDYIPEDWVYLTGFIIGSLSQGFLHIAKL